MTTEPLDATRILACVRAEVARRRTDGREALPGLMEPMPSLPRTARPEPFPIGGAPTLARLLAHNGPQFVSDAYRALLGRDPDSAGNEDYLRRLRSGERTRIDVLGALAFSKEGRRRGVHVPGLRLRYLARRAMRLPLLGAVLSFFATMVRLPALARNQRVLQEEIAALRIEQAQHQDVLAAALEERLGALHAIVAKVDHRVDNVRALAEQMDRIRAGEHRLAEAMAGFADRFRGTSEEIRARLSVYLEPLRFKAKESPAMPIVDLACGRGELLQMLQAEGIYCLGVERDPESVAACRRIGVPVEEADLFEWLRNQPSHSVAAITAMHIVEHFPRPVLVHFLDECHRVLRPHGLLALETPNPANLLVGAWTFWLDPTHVAPLPDQLTSFLVQRAGFRNVEVWPLSPRDARIDAEHSKMADPVLSLSAHHLFGAQDYAVVGIA